MKAQIVIADDERNTREGLKWALESEQRRILLAEDGKKTFELVQSQPIDLVIADLKMPGMDGLKLLKKIKKDYPDTEVIIITGHGTIESAVEAVKLGAFDYLTKPVNLEELNLLIDRAWQHKLMREENLRLRRELYERHRFHNLIGRSQAMQEIFHKIQMVASTKATVLLQGESGTGKELIASAIHYNSPRRDQPFITVNCGALPPTLLESELFGYEKGAFTDAHRSKPGRFELADGGTLFLDEISETTNEFQVKLLRVLQDQKFERLGGTQTIKVDVRFITATNTELKQCMEEGRFREDLYYRLNVIQINVPPLRERPEDIPLLIEHFIRETARENKKDPINISSRAMNLLLHFSWPGNIRQLRNVIEGLVVMAPARTIQPEHLPAEIREASDRVQFLRLPVGVSLRDAEKELIRSTLQALEGNKSRAAKVLGMGRKTLYRKMEEYGLSDKMLESEAEHEP